MCLTRSVIEGMCHVFAEMGSSSNIVDSTCHQLELEASSQETSHLLLAHVRFLFRNVFSFFNLEVINQVNTNLAIEFSCNFGIQQ